MMVQEGVRKRQNQDAQPDQNMDQPNDDVRGTKKKAGTA